MPFDRYAHFYDDFYRYKDYVAESKYVMRIIDDHFGTTKKKSLVDLGCGTGGHLEFFSTHYDAVGYDLSMEMCMMADKKRLIAIQKDIREVKVQADVYISMFHVINYITNVNDWEMVFGNIYNSLNKNGLFIGELYSKEGLKEGKQRDVKTFKHNEHLRVLDRVAEYDGEYLTVKIGIDKQMAPEEHKMLIMSKDRTLKLLEAGGFNNRNITYIKSNLFPKSDLFVCQK